MTSEDPPFELFTAAALDTGMQGVKTRISFSIKAVTRKPVDRNDNFLYLVQLNLVI